MMQKLKSLLFLMLALGAVSVPIRAQELFDENNINYVLARYVEAMGGRAGLENLNSMRISGTLEFENGESVSLVVLKKKPNRVRLTLLSGIQRVIQAYDGQTAWTARESGRRAEYQLMTDPQKSDFIREAPIYNALVDPQNQSARLELGPDVTLVNQPHFQVISHHSDGTKTIHLLNKETFREHRIKKYDVEGNLVAELIPSKFEIVEGVLFALMTKRLIDDRLVSTMNVEQVDVNLGIFDEAFSLPEDAHLGE